MRGSDFVADQRAPPEGHRTKAARPFVRRGKSTAVASDKGADPPWGCDPRVVRRPRATSALRSSSAASIALTGRLRLSTVLNYWGDLLRLAGSLREGTVRASQILPILAGGGRPGPLGRAVIQNGRLDRSAFLARYHHSELFRRKVNTQLNRQESHHELPRRIFYGQKGELRQKYTEGQADQLGALGLALNACVLWNSVYIQEAVNRLRTQGHHIADADLARLSPLGHDHIRMIGRYHFTLPADLAAGDLRPLRTERSEAPVN